MLYKIIRSNHLENFKAQIQSNFDLGWEPHGPMIKDGSYFYKELIKKQKDILICSDCGFRAHSEHKKCIKCKGEIEWGCI